MPAPRKRDEERMRDAGRSKPRTEQADKITPGDLEFLADPVLQPAPNPNWHPIALAWYAALGKSGQSIFYEPSDWAMAMILAEAIHRELSPQYVRMQKTWVKGEKHAESGYWVDGHNEEEPVYELRTMSAATISAILAGMSKLLATEFDRRHFRVEVERGPDHQEAHLAVVTDLAATREELLGGEA